MPKSPLDGRRCLAVVMVGVLIASACSTTARLGGDVRNHPPELVGAWVDVAKSSSADTALWVLGSSGEDGSQHVRRDSGASMPRHYGYWYARGALSDSDSRAICFTNRPGRSAPTCLPFALDSVTDDGGRRHRRLFVHGYQGERRTSDRLLISRDP